VICAEVRREGRKGYSGIKKWEKPSAGTPISDESGTPDSRNEVRELKPQGQKSAPKGEHSKNKSHTGGGED